MINELWIAIFNPCGWYWSSPKSSDLQCKPGVSKTKVCYHSAGWCVGQGHRDSCFIQEVKVSKTPAKQTWGGHMNDGGLWNWMIDAELVGSTERGTSWDLSGRGGVPQIRTCSKNTYPETYITRCSSIEEHAKPRPRQETIHRLWLHRLWSYAKSVVI